MRLSATGFRIMLGVVLMQWLFFAGAGATAQVGAQQQGQAKPSAVSQTPPGSQPVSDTKAPLLDRPITLADFSNMEPRPDLKDKLGHLTHFIQNTPVDGAPATERAEA